MKRIILEKITSFNANFRNPTNHAPSSRGSFLIPLVIVCFALCEQVQAQETPDPGSIGGSFNTADGTNALANVTTGAANSAFGWFSLLSDVDASFNTGVGAGTLLFNNAGDNTAVGAAALLFNTTGSDNTAVGAAALVNNADGSFNNAVGSFALNANISGFFNNAHGRSALINNSASENNAFGDLAMENNTSGASNTAIGDDALRNCVDGSFNVAVGDEAGTSIVSSSNMVAIGAPGAGPFADISNTCFIASIFNQPVSDAGTAQDVFVDQFNVLGFVPSSRKYKHDIQPMDKASEKLYGLKPVTFKYNNDKKGTTQYGVIAEEVAEVAPDLVFHDRNGDVQTVRFEQISAMLLNEFLKEHRKNEEQEATIARQQKQIEALTAGLQKVSAHLRANRSTPQVVANK